MKLCPTHWQALVDAVAARGLTEHSHVTIDTSAAGLLEQLKDTATPGDLSSFDGLGDTATAVIASLGTVDLNADGCPVCNATSTTDTTKIEQAADRLRTVFGDLTTAELRRQVQVLLPALGLTTAKARFDYVAGIIGRPITSARDLLSLTADEAKAVRDALGAALQALNGGTP